MSPSDSSLRSSSRDVAENGDGDAGGLSCGEAGEAFGALDSDSTVWRLGGSVLGGCAGAGAAFGFTPLAFNAAACCSAICTAAFPIGCRAVAGTLGGVG